MPALRSSSLRCRAASRKAGSDNGAQSRGPSGATLGSAAAPLLPCFGQTSRACGAQGHGECPCSWTTPPDVVPRIVRCRGLRDVSRGARAVMAVHSSVAVAGRQILAGKHGWHTACAVACRTIGIANLASSGMKSLLTPMTRCQAYANSRSGLRRAFRAYSGNGKP